MTSGDLHAVAWREFLLGLQSTNRADSVNGLCEHCLVATRSHADTPASTPIKVQPALDPQATLTQKPPRQAPGEHPFARQYQTTRSDADRTRTAQTGETRNFSVEGGSLLPVPPDGYDFIEELGSGGMGTVYLAIEHATQRTVAMKFLHARNSQTALDRFLVEVRALAAMNHPNIINVLEAKTHCREPYFTMDYAEVGTLANLARCDPPISPAEAARLMQGVAEAVAAAHEHGILHRDLKPSNVLLKRKDGATKSDTSSFVPVVSDFGLAKRTDQDEGLTRTGAIGTPSYMSPEAASCRYRDVNESSDVYGLGATLYHLLAGRPPFTGKSEVEILNKVIREPVERLRSVRPEIPAGLEAIALKALEKDPAARYASAKEFAEDLHRYEEGRRQKAPILTRRRRIAKWGRRNWMSAAIISSVLIAIVIFIRIWPDAPSQVEKDIPASDLPLDEAWLADARVRARRGEQIEFVGSTGLPKYHRTFLEPANFGTLPDGTFVVLD